MRHVVDYTLKFFLLFFIFARLVSGPPAETQNGNPAPEPSSDSTT